MKVQTFANFMISPSIKKIMHRLRLLMDFVDEICPDQLPGANEFDKLENKFKMAN